MAGGRGLRGRRHDAARTPPTGKTCLLWQPGRGDELVELEVSGEARRKDPSLPRTWIMRAIRYQRRGFQPQTLLTSLVDPELYPAEELVALYHERWEIELGFDEVKTDMLERQEAIRSKTPKGVLQELWAIGLAY